MPAKERKLKICLVPAPLWNFNLREFLSQHHWRKLRLAYMAEHGEHCQTCGAPPKPKPQRGHHGHEVWEYDTSRTPAVARLTGLSVACWHCHMADHWGALETIAAQAGLKRAVPDTIAHYCRVNGVSRSTFARDKERAFAEWRERSKLKWELDWGPYAERLLEDYTELPHLSWYEGLGRNVA